MIRGYVRVSTKKQAAGTSLEDQRAALRAEGCEALYEDVSTGGSMDRPELDRLCREVRPGDTIAVTKMDRFARTETEAYERVVGWVRSGAGAEYGRHRGHGAGKADFAHHAQLCGV